MSSKTTDKTDSSVSVAGVEWIPLDAIVVREGFNHRLRFDDEDQSVLEDQIVATGECELLGVRRRPDIIDDETGQPQIELMKGERRLRALIELDKQGRLPDSFYREWIEGRFACAPCRVSEFSGDFRAHLLSYTENIGRKDVNWIERVTALAHADAAYRAENPKAKQVDVAKALSVKTPNLSVALSISRQPWFESLRRAYVETGEVLMSEESARMLAPKAREAIGVELVGKAVESGEPVNDAKVARLVGGKAGDEGDDGPEESSGGSKSGKGGKKGKGGGGAGFEWGCAWPEAKELLNRCQVAAKKAAGDKSTIGEQSELVFKEVVGVLDWVLRPNKKLPKFLETSLGLYAPAKKEEQS